MPSFDVFYCLSTFSWSRWEATCAVETAILLFHVVLLTILLLSVNHSLSMAKDLDVFDISGHLRKSYPRKSCPWLKQNRFSMIWSLDGSALYCVAVLFTLITALADVMLKVGRISVDFSRFHFIHDTHWWVGLKLGIHWHVAVTGSLRRVVFYFFWECYYIDFLFK